MIVPSDRVQVFVAMRPVDFRKGMDGLAALVERELGLNPFSGAIYVFPFSGAIYVFRAKRGDWIKVLVWDGSGRGHGDQLCQVARLIPQRGHPRSLWG